MSPTFSVVIPTHDRVELLGQVLDALDAQREPPPFEMVVIDDGSRDGTRAFMEARLAARPPGAAPLTFRSQPNGGPSRARNHGVGLATGRYVVFIGDDTVPEPGFLAEHARAHRDDGSDRWLAVLGYTGWPIEWRVSAFMDFVNEYGLQFGYGLIDHDALVSHHFFYTSNISLDRQLLVEHPFDVGFPAAAWEDVELAYRLAGLGLKIRYNARAITRHHHRMTVESFARRQYAVGKSGAILAARHPELAPALGLERLARHRFADDARLAAMRRRAELGERFRLLPSQRAFRKLMGEHYLRGLRDGLAEAAGGAR